MTTHKEVLKLALEALENYPAIGLAISCADAWNQCQKAITTIKEALAQQSNEQVEPVAWLNRDSVDGLWYPNAFKTDNLEPSIPLYTTPPQRKPLSEAQLEKGRDQTFSINNPFCPCDSKTFRKVARWVEAAHDIKE